MPSKCAPASVKDLFIWTLLLPVIGALQQQPVHNAWAPQVASSDLYDRATAAAERYRAAASGGADSLHTPLSEQRHGYYKDTQTEPHHHTRSSRSSFSSSINERALATLSPAESHLAVRQPPAPRSSAATAGLSSRQPARSLQDWQVEDIILLATVDGKIHARDRKTGAARWQLETDRPMVETTHHRHNKSVDEDGVEHEDPLWIVEPSQDGSIYVYAPSTGFGMQRLGYTVKELAELAPYASEGRPAVTYTAEKKNTLYTVDASTGHILKSFSSAGSHVNEDRSCRRVNPLESLDGDGEECEPIGTLTLGRTEYTIGIQDRDTGEQISTIRYFEWGPNNRDQDLRNKYTTTMDKKYVYTKHDGTIFGLDMALDSDYHPVPAHKPIYRQKLSSPVARVYDLVRPQDDTSGNAQLVLLPQPVGPSPNEFAELEEPYFENVFVNCTPDGSWYALSESKYPTVTEGAATAQCCGDESFTLPDLSWPMSRSERENFMGVHQLATPDGPLFDTPPIGAPERPGIDPPPAQSGGESAMVEGTSSTRDALISIRAVVATLMLCLLAGGLFYRRTPNLTLLKGVQPVITLQQQTPVLEVQTSDQIGPESPVMVREAEPAKETIFSHQEPVPLPEDARDEEDFEKIDSQEAADEIESKDAAEPKKKKATRGKRGGKKAKEREQQIAQAQAQRRASQPAQPAEVISVPASESPQVAGPLQINSLIIHTDKIIGQGSCGTSVFEGSFEGRAVAVKRMLSQYYELASQEVSFLQQSDDHPNVIRYFCQQKDDHFLYIAVELCQASLFEVWEPEKARTEERHAHLRSLKLAIQQDVPKALQQLAAGLYHLHNLRIIHRDIKPQNILVAFPKRAPTSASSSFSRLVISDFGLGKNLPENVSTLVDPTGNAGTSGWKAPELISQPRESSESRQSSHTGESASNPNGASTSGVKRAADIFSLGCLFFWVLTDGIHPYEDENGWQQLRELNIKRDRKSLAVLSRWSDAYEPMHLITAMLAHQPEHRPTALQVLNHPFFWPADKRLAFLCDCSDHFEREARGVPDDDYAGDSATLALLESRAPDVIGNPCDFLAHLDRHFVDTLGKQRKYSGSRLLDLLRALRNKKNHYEDMSDEIKKRVGPLPAGYLGYWCVRFPRLLMACYEVVFAADLQGNGRFTGYFTLGT